MLIHFKPSVVNSDLPRFSTAGQRREEIHREIAELHARIHALREEDAAILAAARRRVKGGAA